MLNDKKKIKKRSKLIALFILELLVLVIIIAGFYFYSKLNRIQHDSSDVKYIIQIDNVKSSG